jgi:hypothetical protein
LWVWTMLVKGLRNKGFVVLMLVNFGYLLGIICADYPQIIPKNPLRLILPLSLKQ